MYADVAHGSRQLRKSASPLLLLLIAACTSAYPSRGAELIRVDHIEASDGPTAWSLVVFTDGFICLEKLGKRRRCKIASAGQIANLRRLLEAAEFRQEPSFDGPAVHVELLQIHHEGAVRMFLADDAPSSIKEVMEDIDLIFHQAFGGKYHWYLIGPRSGP